MKKLALLFSLTLLLAACATKPNFAFLEKVAVDQNTGLTWARNTNMPGKQLIWRGDDNVYEFLKRLNDTNYAGYGDWRVPTRAEFETMIDYAKNMGYDSDRMETWPYQRLRQLGFIDVRDYDYWTSTRQSPTEMYTADLATGKIKPKTESKAYFLWPVRGAGR
jgi:hypothetical protein